MELHLTIPGCFPCWVTVAEPTQHSISTSGTQLLEENLGKLGGICSQAIPAPNTTNGWSCMCICSQGASHAGWQWMTLPYSSSTPCTQLLRQNLGRLGGSCCWAWIPAPSTTNGWSCMFLGCFPCWVAVGDPTLLQLITMHSGPVKQGKLRRMHCRFSAPLPPRTQKSWAELLHRCSDLLCLVTTINFAKEISFFTKYHAL
jgi:hypothetical protein